MKVELWQDQHVALKAAGDLLEIYLPRWCCRRRGRFGLMYLTGANSTKVVTVKAPENIEKRMRALVVAARVIGTK